MADPLEGKTGIQKSTGQRVIRRNGQWVPLQPNGKPEVVEASMRSRLDMGMPSMVAGQEAMNRVEKRGNPFALDQNLDNAAAKALDSVGVKIGQNDIRPFRPVAKWLGGDDYQEYEQGAASFEAEVMPIKSGAAVSPSEAERQIKAALPELGDSPENLRRKATTRKTMLNAAAMMRGRPLPYPDVPTWGVNTMRLPQQQGGGSSASRPATGGVRRYNPQTGRIE